MPRFGAHAFTWESEWNASAAERVIKGAAEAGLEFVEIPILRPDDFDAKHTKALLNQYGLSATVSLGLPSDERLPEYPDKAEAFLNRVFPLCSEIGSPAISGVIYGTLGTISGHPPQEEELETIAKTLKRVAKSAASAGLSLGVEPVNRYETYLINLTDQGLEMLGRIDEPNVFLHLDTYHMNIEEKGFYEPIKRAGKHLKYIHLSESDRGTPGTGNVRWDDIFRGLKDISYEGELVMESFVALNPDIARATCIWRQVAPDSDTLVREGLAFLRAKAEQHGVIGG